MYGFFRLSAPRRPATALIPGVVLGVVISMAALIFGTLPSRGCRRKGRVRHVRTELHGRLLQLAAEQTRHANRRSCRTRLQLPGGGHEFAIISAVQACAASRRQPISVETADDVARPAPAA